MLAEEEPSATAEEVEAEARREPLPAKPVHERKPHPGRKPLPDTLPRVEQVIPCAEPHCSKCGEETRVIGYDESEQLDREPARYFVRVIKAREARLPRVLNGTVTMATAEPRIVEKGLASDRVVIETVVAKYCDHLPLYRQAADPGARSGRGDRPRDAGWLGDAGGRVAAAGGRRDARRICSRERICRPMKRRCRCRCTTSAGRIIRRIYGNTASRAERRYSISAGPRARGSAKVPRRSGKAFCKPTAIRPTTASAGRRLVHVGCWAHARRKFVDAVKVNPQDGEAVKMVTRMDALFLVDRASAAEADECRRSDWRSRREHAEAWAEEIHEECVKLSQDSVAEERAGQGGRLHAEHVAEAARAVSITPKWSCPTTWRRTRCGRWRWAARTGCTWAALKAGPKVAAILSVVESCRRLGVPVKDYLLSVLPGLEHRKLHEVATLTPARWASARP